MGNRVQSSTLYLSQDTTKAGNHTLVWTIQLKTLLGEFPSSFDTLPDSRCLKRWGLAILFIRH